MKIFVVFALYFVAAGASPLGSTSDTPEPVRTQNTPAVSIHDTTTSIPILRQELGINNGSFINNFETGHGIVVNESGSQKQIGDGSGTVSSGAFSFTNPEGAVITVNWVADENGFQATGDHLPTPHPMPEHVVKMLADMEAAALHAISTIP
ncbi:hypothetical protein DAPPUDRAFT_263370 [Daphnia pulex]|uniref:Uncharacterized protein n=1 Tax=Daphnia pulex TaxID=6669 RepID=E9HPL9_DAPPU|nr:hypothetical protein DAPPUDRAFT_263370 [Daphnia pulex]|eukprot:EFX66320.1 hypothetical protein DAPPUDRAFT_263370 [Daphnia pulex]